MFQGSAFGLALSTICISKRDAKAEGTSPSFIELMAGMEKEAKLVADHR